MPGGQRDRPCDYLPHKRSGSSGQCSTAAWFLLKTCNKHLLAKQETASGEGCAISAHPIVLCGAERAAVPPSVYVGVALFEPSKGQALADRRCSSRVPLASLSRLLESSQPCRSCAPCMCPIPPDACLFARFPALRTAVAHRSLRQYAAQFAGPQQYPTLATMIVGDGR